MLLTAKELKYNDTLAVSFQQQIMIGLFVYFWEKATSIDLFPATSLVKITVPPVNFPKLLTVFVYLFQLIIDKFFFNIISENDIIFLQ